jgi:DNA-binding transcriptional LysR family regulator
VLEAELGATLFRRGRPPLALTEAGRFVAAQGGRLLADAALLRQEAMRLHGGRDPTLRVGVRDTLDAALAAAGVTPRPVAELEGIGAILALVQAGLGPSILPASAIGPNVDLITRRLADPVPVRPLGAIWHRSRVPDPALISLFDAVRTMLAGTPQPSHPRSTPTRT